MTDPDGTPPPAPAAAPASGALPRPPRWLMEPANVVYAGMAVWLIATIVIAATGLGTTSTLITALVGLAVGVFGTSVFLTQRRASRRGDRAAQRGLD